MNLFKRGLVSTKANIGRTLLLSLIFITVMIAINAVVLAGAQYERIQKKLFSEGEVPVSVEMETPTSMLSSLTYNWEDYKEISPEQSAKLGELETVESVQKSAYQTVNTEDVKLEDGLDEGIYVEYMDNLSIEDDAIKLNIDQAEYSNKSGVVINDEVLESNGLSVGDMISINFNDPYGETDIEELKNIEVPIVGTFTVEITQEMIDQETQSAEQYGYEPDLSFSYYYSSVYMPMSYADMVSEIAISDGGENSEQLIYFNYIYNLQSLDSVKQFKADAEEVIGVPLNVQIRPQEANEMVDIFYTFESYKWLVLPIIKAVIAILSILLIVILTIIVRGRRKEIGILVALGEKRWKIYVQMLVEQLTLMVVATLISYPAVSLILVRIVTSLSGDAELDILVLPLLVSIGFGAILVFVATLIPAVYTMKVSPKKILL